MRSFLLTHWKQEPCFRGLRRDQKGSKGRQWEHITQKFDSEVSIKEIKTRQFLKEKRWGQCLLFFSKESHGFWLYLGLCCCGQGALVPGRAGATLVSGCGPLVVAEHKCGLVARFVGSRAQAQGAVARGALVAVRHVGSSRIMDRTGAPCTGRKTP